MLCSKSTSRLKIVCSCLFVCVAAFLFLVFGFVFILATIRRANLPAGLRSAIEIPHTYGIS